MTFYYEISIPGTFVNIEILIWFNTEIKTPEPSDLSNYEGVKPKEYLS